MQTSTKLFIATAAAIGCFYAFKSYENNIAKTNEEDEGNDPEIIATVEQIKRGSKESVKEQSKTGQSHECVIDEIRTLSTRWSTESDAINGKQIHYKNNSGKTVFLRIIDEPTGKLLETILILDNESIKEPLFSDLTRIEIQTGSKWCNRQDGWKDKSITIARKPLNTIGRNGTFEYRIGANSKDGGITISIGENLAEQPQVAEKEKGLAIVSPESKRQEQTARKVEQKERKLSFQPPSKIIGEVVKPVSKSVNSPAPMEQNVQEIQSMATQDWRDIPPRDIRLVSKYGRHFAGGRVGDEDVQFEIARYGFSAVNEELAAKSGAIGCSKGTWTVSERVWTTCMKIIPHIQFGSVQLDNVFMVVLPGSNTPVLGTDLLRNWRIFRGVDGDYIEVGRK